MMPFCNNLRKDDEVLHVPSGRRGRVTMQPRDESVKTQVLLVGLNTPRYFPVTDLRLIVDGVPESVPPMDGAPTTSETVAATPTPPPSPKAELPPPEAPAATGTKPKQEVRSEEHEILDRILRFEAKNQPIKPPVVMLNNGEHLKKYVVTSAEKDGSVRADTVEAKGIITAITLFYMQTQKTAIISVVCIL